MMIAKPSQYLNKKTKNLSCGQNMINGCNTRIKQTRSYTILRLAVHLFNLVKMGNHNLTEKDLRSGIFIIYLFDIRYSY